MVRQASDVRKRLRRFLTADPGRFAGGSAVSDPLGLLAVERERLAVLRSPQHDGSPQTAAATTPARAGIVVPDQIESARGSAPHAPGVPQYSRFPGPAAPAARINHGNATVPWSGPRQCNIVVVTRDSAL